jgi:hypothetical protein
MSYIEWFFVLLFVGLVETAIIWIPVGLLALVVWAIVRWVRK